MARGGRRTPKRPAAVSNPGSGQRTDGGAGSRSQPLRVANDQPYGERQASVAQQQAAPLAVAGGTPPSTSSGATPAVGGSGTGLPPLDVFGPTQRPNEPVTAGIDQNSLVPEADPDMMLRAIYEVFPHPSIARLLPEY